MKHSRNRLTPFLVIILIILIWILIAVVAYKLMHRNAFKGTKLKLDDDLVQELYNSVNDEDIILFSNNKYDLNNLPGEYLIRKASLYMTLEDIEFTNSMGFILSYESLDSAIKMAFGPDIKYNLKNFSGEVDTYLEMDEKRLHFKMHYDDTINSYVGSYEEVALDESIKVKRELLRATKTDTVNLRIGYFFYKEKDNKYQICKDASCKKIVKTIDSLDIDYDNYIEVSMKKASDEVYYYYQNS